MNHQKKKALNNHQQQCQQEEASHGEETPVQREKMPAPENETLVKVTPTLFVVGLIALVLGLCSGFVMSTASLIN